ncbi:MAG: recombinase family protein, partial [Cyanobacteria bacterium CAN_BIN43]|nr:recombinase family protein [Cyanobacteria bacterium CAN_BIN43]
MLQDSIWITGTTRSGKTQRLIEQFLTWAERETPAAEALFLAATGDNRLDLADRITTEAGQFRFDTATPIGFFQDEVTLFFPLLVQQLGLKDQFPLRLRPETEQELATGLWQSLLTGNLQQAGVSDYYLVRRTLDLLQLAAASGAPPEDIAALLKAGFSAQEGSPELWESMGAGLEQWRTWLL